MKTTKTILIAITVIIIAACSSSKKISTSTAASTPVSVTTTTVSSAPAPTTTSANAFLVKPVDGIYAPGNEELTAIQVQYKDVTLDKLKEGHVLYTQSACISCHSANITKRNGKILYWIWLKEPGYLTRKGMQFINTFLR